MGPFKCYVTQMGVGDVPVECADRDETGSHQKKLTNPTPEGFRGLFMFVGCGMIQAGGR